MKRGDIKMKRIVGLWLIWLLLLTGTASAVELVRQKSQATRILFPITDSSGTIVTGCTCDVEYTSWADNGNPGAFANIGTNSCTEINNGDAALSGWYYITLASGELASDYTALKIVTSVCSSVNQRVLIRTMVGDPLLSSTTTSGTESTAQTGDSYSLLNTAAGEPGQAAPNVSLSPIDKIRYIYKFMRNKTTQTATTTSIYNDAGDTVDQKSTVSDNGTTFEREEYVSGP
jgi:hypothetical protein